MAAFTDEQVENIVRRSYQYVAMYNVNNKFALKQGGWNTVMADTKLKDHTMREIARPNNDSLYIGCLLDLRKDPVILNIPAIDSKYVSLMITAYDHYVNIPMAARMGDFRKPMNANHDYVIRMAGDDIPPTRAFWSFTLYDTKNGFFIPNDRKKYSVGENGGMKLDADGGIAIHIAAEKPEGVPEENWLLLNRGDYGIDVILRLYNPDLEKFKTWSPPKAERVQ